MLFDSFMLLLSFQVHFVSDYTGGKNRSKRKGKACHCMEGKFPLHPLLSMLGDSELLGK